LLTRSIKFQQVIESDLIADDIQFYGTVDYIIHCAGIVHFREAGNKNEEMMVHVIALAHKLSAPIHFVSTAFVDRADGSDSFNNHYEQDKFNAEQLLINQECPTVYFDRQY
jgi:thioester reductase-like protein